MIMRKARVFNFGIECGCLAEVVRAKEYSFTYREGYDGPPVSLTMPVAQREFLFKEFPPFFDGLLPEGYNLDALCRLYKVDKNDSFRQLLIAGRDVVGSVTVEPFNE